MSAFDAKVEIGGVIDALRRVERLPTAKVFREAKPLVRRDIREHTRRQEGEHGRWRDLAATTKARRARSRRGRSRKLLGRLPMAMKISSDKDRIRVVWLARFSRVHQEGGPVGRGGVVQAREFAFVSRGFKLKLRDLFREALWRAWSRR